MSSPDFVGLQFSPRTTEKFGAS